jgi:hypothetical protein
LKFFQSLESELNNILKTKINIRIRTLFLTKSIIRRKNFIVALILVVLVLILSLAFSSQSAIPEREEIAFVNGVVKKAKTTNKLLVIEFWAPECTSSTKLKEEIFENERNKEFLENNFLIVKVCPSDQVYYSLFKHFNLDNQNACIFMDINGNEIDRSVNYDGNRNAYLNFLKDVSEGRNLYCQVFMAYKKDSMDVRNNYLLAKKMLFRCQIKDAINKFNNVILLDPRNSKGYNEECKLKIAESILILKEDPTFYPNPFTAYR